MTSDPIAETVEFDLRDTPHEFMGFGAQVFGHAPDDSCPNLLDIRRRALAELGIKYVRIELSVPMPAMQAMRALTDELGIKWVLMLWIGPAHCMDEKHRLTDIDGFANWWLEQVRRFDENGIRPEYLELMNEPDSRGEWSTGITGEQFDKLVISLRAKLDEAGYPDVGIVGPGTCTLAWDNPKRYLGAITDEGVAALAAWSIHTWGNDQQHDTDLNPGGPALEAQWADFGRRMADRGPEVPCFVTEYATHERLYHGVEYPHGDRYGEWDESKVFPYFSVTNCMPYAVRVYENTLALLNCGADVPFIWQANDEPIESKPPGRDDPKRKAWGLVDLWNKPKPVFGALKTLYPKIPIGARVVRSPDQSANGTYSGVVTHEESVIVGIANNTGDTRAVSLTLQGVDPRLGLAEAIAFEQAHWGDASRGEPDRGREVEREVAVEVTDTGVCVLRVELPPESVATVVLANT